jgi:hypothetical protein
MPDAARGWSSIPRKAKAFRIAHAAAAFVNLAGLAYIWLCAARRRRNRRLGLSVGLLLAEGGALLIGRGNCPLGPFQRSLGDPVPLFELVLPPRAAKAAIPLLTAVTLAAFTMLAARPPAHIPHAPNVAG